MVALVLWSSTMRQRADVTYESMINLHDRFRQQAYLSDSEIIPLLGLNLYDSIGKERALNFSVGGFTS